MSGAGGVARENFARGLIEVALSRPERANAIDAGLVSALLKCVMAIEADPDARVIMLVGQGKHFCSGADVSHARNDNRDRQADGMGSSLRDMLLAWDAIPKPTICFVQGACIGAGLALASCCDIVIADPKAFFAIPEVRLGMIPSLSPFFARAIGPRQFRRYGLSGERFGPEVALRCGLVSEIVDQTDWEQARSRLLDSYLHAAPGAFAAMKAQARDFGCVETEPPPRPASAKVEVEAAEGKASFKEKRKPSWYIAP